MLLKFITQRITENVLIIILVAMLLIWFIRETDWKQKCESMKSIHIVLMCTIDTDENHKVMLCQGFSFYLYSQALFNYAWAIRNRVFCARITFHWHFIHFYRANIIFVFSFAVAGWWSGIKRLKTNEWKKQPTKITSEEKKSSRMLIFSTCSPS